MSDLDKVMKKIKKLLAMAGDVSSPNEALIAAGRARSLMDKHQISKADIEKNLGDQFHESSAEKETKKAMTWLRLLAFAVALLNDCRCVLQSGRIVIYKFQGFKTDAVVAKLTMDYLVEVCERGCEKSNASGLSQKNFFRLGFSEEIIFRAREITNKRKKEVVCTGTGTALVPLKTAMVEAHFGTLKSARQPTKRSPNAEEYGAYIKGVAHGRDTGLDKQVAGEEQKRVNQCDLI